MHGAGTLFVEQWHPAWVTEFKNWTGAASTSDIVNLALYNHVAFLIQSGAWAGGTSAITLEQCQDVAGTGAKALAFTKMFTNSADATGDRLVETAVTSNTFTIGAANAMYIIEVDADTLDVDNGFNCVRIKGASPGSNADIYGVVAFLGAPMSYGGRVATQKSALVDV